MDVRNVLAFLRKSMMKASTTTYIKTLDGSVTVFLSGVVHKGTLMFQQHLDAVDCPNSENEDRERETVLVFIIHEGQFGVS